MAQEFTPILENDIGALAPDRTPAKVRAIDDQGRSINLTPTQLAAMAGIDYSLLTEQEVPGEKWPDPLTAQPKQVYVRTFMGTTPSYYANGMNLVTDLTLSGGYTACFLYMVKCKADGTDVNTYEGVLLQNANGNLQLVMKDVAGFSRRSQPFVATVFYTK